MPQYVSAGVVGITSGHLLERYVPEELPPGMERRRPEMMWGLVAAASFLSPLLLALFRSRLFGDEPTLRQPPATPSPRTLRRRDQKSAPLYGMVGNGVPGHTPLAAADDEELAETL